MTDGRLPPSRLAPCHLPQRGRLFRPRNPPKGPLPEGQLSRALPAAETARRSWRSAPIFTRGLRPPPGKLAKRKRTVAQRQGDTLKGRWVGFDQKQGALLWAFRAVGPDGPSVAPLGQRLRSRGAACGRNSRGGAGAAVQIFKRTAFGAENLANGNPEEGGGFDSPSLP